MVISACLSHDLPFQAECRLEQLSEELGEQRQAGLVLEPGEVSPALVLERVQHAPCPIMYSTSVYYLRGFKTKYKFYFSRWLKDRNVTGIRIYTLCPFLFVGKRVVPWGCLVSNRVFILRHCLNIKTVLRSFIASSKWRRLGDASSEKTKVISVTSWPQV